jgi:hypothetical protein
MPFPPRSTLFAISIFGKRGARPVVSATRPEPLIRSRPIFDVKKGGAVIRKDAHGAVANFIISDDLAVNELPYYFKLNLSPAKGSFVRKKSSICICLARISDRSHGGT